MSDIISYSKKEVGYPNLFEDDQRFVIIEKFKKLLEEKKKLLSFVGLIREVSLILKCPYKSPEQKAAFIEQIKNIDFSKI